MSKHLEWTEIGMICLCIVGVSIAVMRGIHHDAPWVTEIGCITAWMCTAMWVQAAYRHRRYARQVRDLNSDMLKLNQDLLQSNQELTQKLIENKPWLNSPQN